MRVIAGECRGRRLAPVGGLPIRPTPDRVREAVFNILGQRVRDARVADLFAGTGAMGIEALSRGAAEAVFIDRLPGALDLVKKNLAALGLAGRARVVRADPVHGLEGVFSASRPLDLLFLDPPYASDALAGALENLRRAGCLAPGAVLVCEHAPGGEAFHDEDAFSLTDQRRYGKTLVSFFSPVL